MVLFFSLSFLFCGVSVGFCNGLDFGSSLSHNKLKKIECRIACDGELPSADPVVSELLLCHGSLDWGGTIIESFHLKGESKNLN